jgi:hypothetical protein
MTNYSSTTEHDLFLYLKGVSVHACVCHLVHDIIPLDQKNKGRFGISACGGR